MIENIQKRLYTINVKGFHLKIYCNGGKSVLYEKLNQQKKKMGITTEQLSRLSGVPVGTINKILRGETKAPRYDTLQALERVLFADCSSQWKENGACLCLLSGSGNAGGCVFRRLVPLRVFPQGQDIFINIQRELLHLELVIIERLAERLLRIAFPHTGQLLLIAYHFFYFGPEFPVVALQICRLVLQLLRGYLDLCHCSLPPV